MDTSFRVSKLIIDLVSNYDPPSTNTLMGYMPWSSNPTARKNAPLIFDAFVSRTKPEDLPQFNINSNEVFVFRSRAKTFANDNESYLMAMKFQPTVSDLKKFGELNPSWTFLFPIKLYLLFHPELATEYDGLQPFGANVAAYYNALVENTALGRVGTQPSLHDHISLANITNLMSRLSGKTPVWINSEMFIDGGN
jgi:hypothetical protein